MVSGPHSAEMSLLGQASSHPATQIQAAGSEAGRMLAPALHIPRATITLGHLGPGSLPSSPELHQGVAMVRGVPHLTLPILEPREHNLLGGSQTHSRGPCPGLGSPVPLSKGLGLQLGRAEQVWQQRKVWEVSPPRGGSPALICPHTPSLAAEAGAPVWPALGGDSACSRVISLFVSWEPSRGPSSGH